MLEQCWSNAGSDSGQESPNCTGDSVARFCGLAAGAGDKIVSLAGNAGKMLQKPFPMPKIS